MLKLWSICFAGRSFVPQDDKKMILAYAGKRIIMIIGEVELVSLPLYDTAGSAIRLSWSTNCPFMIVVFFFLYREMSFQIHEHSSILVISRSIRLYPPQSQLDFAICEYPLYGTSSLLGDPRESYSRVRWGLCSNWGYRFTRWQKRKCHDTCEHKKTYSDELEIFFHVYTFQCFQLLPIPFYLLLSLIHRYIREAICLRILFTEYVGERDFSSPIGDMSMYFCVDLFEFDTLDLVVARELLDHEKTICTQFYLRRTEFDRAGDAQECCSVFCDIVRGDTDVFEPFFYDVPICIMDKNPAPRRSRIATRTPISIYYMFHILYPSFWRRKNPCSGNWILRSSVWRAIIPTPPASGTVVWDSRWTSAIPEWLSSSRHLQEERVPWQITSS